VREGVRVLARVSRADDPAAYLCRIVVNESLREARRSSLLSLREEVWQPPSAPSDRIEERLDLGRLLGLLPVKQRAVVVLRFLEDQPVAAVARTLGISEGTVKRQSFDAVRTLRRAMTATGGPAARGAVATRGPARSAGPMTAEEVRDV
jgi:RNA polymerase sigma factor (sigma-70 family)